MDVTLLKELKNPPRRREEGFGITVAEFSRGKNCGEEMARNFLNKAVEEGILVKEYMSIKGKAGRVAVYYRPRDKSS
jgi:hypothetical protein